MGKRVVYRGKYRALAMVLGFAALVGAFGASTSLAKSPPPVGNCTWPSSVQPFLPWADPGLYFLVPGGSFEGSMGDWSRTGATSHPWSRTGATQVVSGNESSYVNSPSDSHSLSLPTSSSATTPLVCITVLSPDLRLFLRNTGNGDSKLAVDVNYTDSHGNPKTARVGEGKSGANWTLSPQLLFLKPVQDLLKKNGQTLVSFTFRPLDNKGNWQIDDLYIDPLKSQ
jgi:hypothetical protein